MGGGDFRALQVLPRLDGRSLARLACVSASLQAMITDGHPAWWSAHSQLLTNRQASMSHIVCANLHALPSTFLARNLERVGYGVGGPWSKRESLPFSCVMF